MLNKIIFGRRVLKGPMISVRLKEKKMIHKDIVKNIETCWKVDERT